MERQLLLSVRKGKYSVQAASQELHTIRRMLPGVESFETFISINDVFDVVNSHFISNTAKLRAIYSGENNESPRYRIIGRN